MSCEKNKNPPTFTWTGGRELGSDFPGYLPLNLGLEMMCKYVPYVTELIPAYAER